jgi:hypothetical protein
VTTRTGSSDGVITYCYDSKGRTMTFVLFSRTGDERVRIVAAEGFEQSGAPTLTLEQRRSVLRTLGLFFGAFNP